MQRTKLSLESILPLTCSRSGSCCFGKDVMLNPWELLCFSKEKKITSRQFRDLYCELGGVKLLFNGKRDVKGQLACSQYVENEGCSVHLGRPLACRLYPLGRYIQFSEAHYMYQGDKFPCLNDCSEVLKLPKLNVAEYIKGQETSLFEKAQDEYLLVMQNIADIGFELLLDAGLATTGDTKTLKLWRALGTDSPKMLAEKVGNDWMDCLMIPDINMNSENPIAFAQIHNELLLTKAQNEFGNIQTYDQLREASVLMIAVALHLSRGLGADTKGISEHWIDIAKKHGAKE